MDELEQFPHLLQLLECLFQALPNLDWSRSGGADTLEFCPSLFSTAKEFRRRDASQSKPQWSQPARTLAAPMKLGSQTIRAEVAFAFS